MLKAESEFQERELIKMERKREMAIKWLHVIFKQVSVSGHFISLVKMLFA